MIKESKRTQRDERKKAELVQGIRDAYSEGLDMRGSKIEDTKYRFTIRYCRRYFKDWDDALMKVLGKTSADFKAMSLEQPKTDFLISLKAAYGAGIDLSSTAQSKAGRGESYYWKAQKFFKGRLFWEEALEAAGLPVQAIIRQNNYTKEKVKKLLLKRLADNESLKAVDIRENSSGFWKGICSNFSSYEEALKYAGIKTAGIIKKMNSWTEESIVLAIINLHIKGCNLNESHILHNETKREKRVVWAANHRFSGGWEEAVNTAGIDYNLYRHRTASWDKDKVILTIAQMHKNGESLNAGSISSSLSHAAIRYVGSWQKAVEAAGLSYKDICKTQKMPNKKEIIEMIKTLKADGCDVHCTAIVNNANSEVAKLYHQANVKFDGGWDEALMEAGLKPAEVRQKTKKYAKEELVAMVKRWHGLGIDLSPASLASNIRYSKYYRAAVRRFHSWEEFLKQCDIDPKPFIQRTDWKDGEEVLNYLKEKFPEGIVTGVSNDRNFAAAAQKYFGSIESAVNKAGLVYSLSGKISKEMIKNSRTIGILYKCNKSYLEQIADKVFFSAYKGRTYERSDLSSEAFVVMCKVLPEKPPKTGLREFCYKYIKKALSAYNKPLNEVLWGEEVYFDLFGEKFEDDGGEDEWDSEEDLDDDTEQEDGQNI